ncbi:MAG: hypothetical protein NPIRA03_23340 [Nitrospirales bacterium]|nr:MAG: hypothetical protein NPIRA03_23340 [Nitrospirales bacterium]
MSRPLSLDSISPINPYKGMVLNLFSTDVQCDSFGGIPQVRSAVEGHGMMPIPFQIVRHVGTPMG